MNRRKIRVVAGVVCVAALCSRAAGIVAGAGGDYPTIQAALNAAQPGDTVYVVAGTYNEKISFPRNGSQQQGRIVLTSREGAKVVLDGTSKTAAACIAIDNRSYITVNGLEVCNNTATSCPIGISVRGSGTGITISNCVVHDIRKPTQNAHGIAVYGTSGTTPISDLLIEGCEIHDCQLGQSESMVLNGNVDGFVVQNNIVHDNDNIGIDFIGFEGTASSNDQARNGICRGNRVYNISSTANPTYGGDGCADGIYVDGGRDIVIEGNVVDNCDIGIEVASEHGGKATSNIIVRSNVVSRSTQGNILTGGYASGKGRAENITIVNNTLYQGRGAEIALQYNNAGVVIKNNILYGRSGSSYIDAWGSNNTDVTVENNLYYGAGNSVGSFKDAQAIFADPGLLDAPRDMRIAASSPAVDKGLTLAAELIGTLDCDGLERVAGDRPDCGAYEIQGATISRRVQAPAVVPDLQVFAQGRGFTVCAAPGERLQALVVDGCGRTIAAFSGSGRLAWSAGSGSVGTFFVQVRSGRRQAFAVVNGVR